MRILIAAGGSGGHLLPAQQLARDLAKDGEILFAGFRLDESPFFDRQNFSYQSISSAPFRLSLFGFFSFIRGAIRGLIESIRLIRRFQPDVIVGFGSYHVFPVLFATMILRRPLVLFEANCLLGKVNRLFARYAKIVASQFSLTQEMENSKLVPLLPWNRISKIMDQKQARALLGLDANKPTFLVFGGSQGAMFINRRIPQVLPKDAQVIHLAGNDREAALVTESYSKADIFAIVKSFESNMPSVYAASDYAICRSGAGTVAELIQHGIPALLIPFPHAAENHQHLNAEFLAKKICGATMLCEQFANEESLQIAIEFLQHQANRMQTSLFRYRQECDGRKSLCDEIIHLGRKL